MMTGGMVDAEADGIGADERRGCGIRAGREAEASRAAAARGGGEGRDPDAGRGLAGLAGVL